MKTFKSNFLFVSILALVFSFSSCSDEKFGVSNESSGITNFDFKTTTELNVSVTTLDNTNNAIGGVYVELYTQNPLMENGTLKADAMSYLIFKGLTNLDGTINTKIAPATYVDSLSIIVNHVGLPNYQAVKISSPAVNVFIGGTYAQNTSSKAAQYKANAAGIWWVSDFWKVNDFYAYAKWSNAGVPADLEKPNDVISADFLADVNASLPERIALPVSHPEYLTSKDDGSVVLIEDAEVWVTFVHEGAGNLNTLAYYTFPNDNPPATAKDILYSTIIYPNVSYVNSGGGLVSGNKVQLLYYDATKAQYTNIFPAGTTVAWIFRANGWNANSFTVQSASNTFYSDKRFNPESDVNLKKHNVVLRDDNRKLLLMGFEDLRRDNGSDNDFNDGVFYTTVTPYSAVKDGIYQTIDTPKDTDGDGVSDSFDEYPTDPTRAFNNYYPGKGQVGTLAFEDLWPYKGDYDFNDLVVDYNFNQITNAKNQTVAVEAQLTVRAIGALYKNGFGIEFNTTPDNVLSVTGQKLSEKILDIASNGTENKQDKAVIMAFDNAYTIIPQVGGLTEVNTVNGGTYQTPGVVNLKIEFKNPIDFAAMGTAPYNPFIFVHGQRSKEVHLATKAPTSLADINLFGTGQDNSDLSKSKYYMSDNYFPWAINVPVKFDYPAEKENISKAYTNFNKWVQSNGLSNKDWYLNLSGYRDNSKIFTK